MPDYRKYPPEVPSRTARLLVICLLVVIALVLASKTL